MHAKLQGRAVALLLIVLVMILPAYRAGAAEQAPPTDTPVVSAAELPSALAAADPGATLIVDGGVLNGTLIIDRSVTLIGRNWPVIDGGNRGTVVQISAPGTTLSNFVIRNSGDSLDQENAGVAVEAPRAVLSGNRFEETLFGIYLREADETILRNNTIDSKALDLPRRGDPIRVWYSNDVLIEGNRVARGRDVVLWYSERLTVRGNDVSDGRYGLHFMYCDDALIENNRLLGNSVGTFMMYSRRLTLENNTIAGNRGPSGYGVGLKDMDDAIINRNLFLDNRVGAHLDGSPREVDSIGHWTGNVFAYNDIGVNLLPSVRHNVFSSNSFVENEQQVAIAGGGQPGSNEWSAAGQGNYWSDYAGYDADADGRGDLPYRAERLYEELTANHPELRLFLYSPITNALDFAARAFPLVRPQPKLEDPQPLMTPQIPAAAPPLPAESNYAWLLVGPALIALALTLIGLPRLRRARYRLTARRALTN